MRKFLFLCAALWFAGSPVEGQGIPFVTASVERWSVGPDHRPLQSYGGGAALGVRSDRGFVQLRGGWFPEQEHVPRLAVIGFEGGPRVLVPHLALGAQVGWGGFHASRLARSTGPDCGHCLSEVLIGPHLRDGWSGYGTAGAGAAWRATPWLDVGISYRLTAVLVGVNHGDMLQGWNFAVTHAMR